MLLPMQFLRIVILSIIAACLYGVAHDQVTARICVEYFTIGHPRLFGSTSPTLLGLVWGVVATWWMGAILGVPLAMAARLGRRVPLRDVDLVVPLAILLASMAVIALIAGIIGRWLAETGGVWLVGRLAESVPEDRHIDFLTTLWAHAASYLAGTLGGLTVIGYVIRLRKVRARGAASS
jgi:hypothetical protein